MAIETTSALLATSAGGMHVETGGSGPRDLIAITPIGSAWTSRALPKALGDVFTIHVVDLPGTGESPAGSEAPSVASIIAAIDAVADALRSDRPLYLWGHSMNGTLALAAAASVANAGVIAVAPAAALPPDPALSTTYWQARAEPERKARAGELVAAHEAAVDADRPAIRELHDRLRRWFDLSYDPTELDALATFDMGWVTAVFESGNQVDWPATFRAIDAPVLLALGDYDFVAPPSAWTDDVVPRRATVERFSRSGHTPFLEQPEEFVGAVERWLAASD